MAASNGFDRICEAYTYVTPTQIKEVLTLDKRIWNNFAGAGIDLGAGAGCITAAISTSPKVLSIISLDIVDTAVELCQPIVFARLSAPNRAKISSVVGSFDELALPNSSIDFGVMWDSFHHSNDPVETLTEVGRVLKQGAKLTIIDRAHENSTPDAVIEDLLDIEYDTNFKRENFMDTERPITRRMNGEHEWKFSEIHDFLDKAGFDLEFCIGVASKVLPPNSLGYDEIYHPVDLGGHIKRKYLFSASRR
jgi:ubiquinone/menaquinone biosynthesis C-methylase UbiE